MSFITAYLVSIPGYTIAIQEFGDPEGTPVIALHGWLDNSESFYAIGEHLAGIKLISLDLVGHGKSSFRPKGMPYHIWDNVTDLEAVVSELNLQQLNLLGHSMGASIAMLFAGAFPNMVNNLMCIEGLVPLHYDAEQLPNDLSAAITKRKKMAGKAYRSYTSRKEAMLARMNGRWPVSERAAKKLLERGLVKKNEGYCWSHDPALLMPSLVRFCPTQIRSFIRSVTANTTVVKGTNGASQLMDGWVEELNTVDFLEMEGGHHLHMEPHAAKEIATIINTWAQ
ncbi:MAG: alpha/beta fold hydrolase [Neptuniibacter sp.]